MSAGVIDTTIGSDATEAATLRKIGWIRDAAGQRFGDLELQTRVHLAMVTEDRRSIADIMPAWRVP
jgi:hypothetical protein